MSLGSFLIVYGCIFWHRLGIFTRLLSLLRRCGRCFVRKRKRASPRYELVAPIDPNSEPGEEIQGKGLIIQMLALVPPLTVLSFGVLYQLAGDRSSASEQSNTSEADTSVLAALAPPSSSPATLPELTSENGFPRCTLL